MILVISACLFAYLDLIVDAELDGEAPWLPEVTIAFERREQVMVSATEIHGGYSVGAIAEIAQNEGYRISGSDRRMLGAFVDLDVVR